MLPVSLSCEGVSKAFNRRWLFKGLTFSVPFGTGLVIAGPNGSGKTTLLRLLCGLTTPTQGHIVWRINGEDFSPQQARPFMGVLLPDAEPYGELTAWENLLFVAEARGITTAKAREWLKRVALETDWNRPVREFSSGMRVRLKLAMALLHEPPILLLDEPTAVMDMEGRELVKTLITEQKRRGVVLIATNEERDFALGERRVVLGQTSFGCHP